MDDLIKRQDVLELIDSYNRDALGSVFGNYYDGMKFKYEVLKLQSAQPSAEKCWGCNCPKMRGEDDG